MTEKVAHNDRAQHKNKQHYDKRKAWTRDWPEMKCSTIRTIRQSRTQTKIEIRRCRDCPETADDLSQPRLLLIELATLGTRSHVLVGSNADCLAERQLVELLADHFTIVFSHNFFTYK